MIIISLATGHGSLCQEGGQVLRRLHGVEAATHGPRRGPGAGAGDVSVLIQLQEVILQFGIACPNH